VDGTAGSEHALGFRRADRRPEVLDQRPGHGLTHLPAPLRHIIAAAFAHALPPIYAYLIPLLAPTFLLALMLKEIALHTHAHRDAAQAGPSPASTPADATTSPGPWTSSGSTRLSMTALPTRTGGWKTTRAALAAFRHGVQRYGM
jgi:hypothetical protein